MQLLCKNMCTLVCRCPQRPEEKVGCCGVGVIGGCEPLDMGTAGHVRGVSGPLEEVFLFLILSHFPSPQNNETFGCLKSQSLTQYTNYNKEK